MEMDHGKHLIAVGEATDGTTNVSKWYWYVVLLNKTTTKSS